MGKSLGRRIANAVSGLITVCTLAALTIVLCLLALSAMVSTSFVTTKDATHLLEHTFFLPNNPLLGIVALALVLAALALLAKPALRLARWLDANDTAFRRARRALVALTGIVCIAWLAATQPTPRSDQAIMMQLARDSLNGEWGNFTNHGYLGCFTSQIGLFWVFRLFAQVFGSADVFAFQLVNVLAAMVMMWELLEITALAGGSRLCQLATSLLAILFFPMLQYVAFVYGNLLGLALSLAAIKHEMRFFRSPEPRLVDAITSAALVGLATVVKGNYAVFLLGMILYALVRLPERGVRPAAIAAGLLVVAYMAQSWISLQMARYASSYPIDQGCSPWGWITMGAQESDLASGWWNNYNWDSYMDARHNTAAQEQVAKRDLVLALQEMREGEGGMVGFYLRKTASQWNNPTFEGFWIVQSGGIGNPSDLIANSVGNDAWMAQFSVYLHVLQFLIIVGAVCWAVTLGWGSQEARTGVVLAIVFVGGFACHLLWEAKCQYTLPYFELLIPLAALGYARLMGYAMSRRMHRDDANVQPKESGAAFACKCGALACAAILCVALCASGSLDGIRMDTAEFNAYLQQSQDQ
ncbi:MAG: hypothetical protein Q4A01_04980 [Coriobacteriales bacterium]|nr:hypothetical protein [Coriobacteriales bacterium]